MLRTLLSQLDVARCAREPKGSPELHAIRILFACDVMLFGTIFPSNSTLFALKSVQLLCLLLRLADLLLRPSLLLPQQSDTVRQEDGVLSTAI